ncbi:hypothetical protein [Clostridium felsineum]|uniref:Uncharacterized protein n=1 Tax=Clostridium felsineum TaxID=36839 RepID=A0A1S8KXC5_9CLOT|nr:hypothetical protein [Clostridium felsineum]MCR3758363.1 hypothetical protein [Clostridium felsineum]URZ03724.1 hypothetical protein CLAUR_037850 [Clostridium felsineum]URZ07970.1 hypothetical protein CLROS_033360 [Clostridium felsineum]URZ13001.1 hypothetical protein CROST_037510 [Clostridium felsineum]URZ15008.1 hypothetical protein CLFE_010210 [Clostridium felsineum DSM 794]
MTFNTSIVIALKNKYGSYDINEVTIFELKELNILYDNFELHVENKKINIKIKCNVCDEYHNFSYNISDIFKREVLIGGCETLGIPVIFIGRPDKVENRIKKYSETNKKLYMMI